MREIVSILSRMVFLTNLAETMVRNTCTNNLKKWLEIHRDRETERDRERKREIEKDRERQRERQRERDR